MNLQKNKREKSIEFWAQPKLKLLGKSWSFYIKKSYMVQSLTYHWLQQCCLRITIGLINCNHNVIGHTDNFEESLG